MLLDTSRCTKRRAIGFLWSPPSVRSISRGSPIRRRPVTSVEASVSDDLGTRSRGNALASLASGPGITVVSHAASRRILDDAMAVDLWTHQFCLACDKQVQSDGAAYCSEACRLADHEWTSTPSSQASSPATTPPCDGHAWPTGPASPSKRIGLQLPRAFDFGGGCKSTYNYPSRVGLYLGGSPSSDAAPAWNLTPSNSHSSLCLMQSTTSPESAQLSDRSRQELRAYAMSFEQVRRQGRRSH